MSDVTQHVSTDGTIYLHTHYGESAASIASALTPHIGRTMSADLPNNYGHYRRYRVALLAVDGPRVTLREVRSGITDDFDAFDVFGTNCTMIEPER